MSSTPLLALVARCRVLCRPRSQAPDAELLERFAQQRDAAAFEELLERYAPLVWGVCRRLGLSEADGEDAFQATFLALVRQAGRLHGRQPLGGWLHTVAVRVGRKTRARARREQPQSVLPERATAGDVAETVGSRELFRIVDEEIERLPAAQRAAMILCCLQGRTRDEAAAALGCSVAAIKGRLERGRELLRRRLQRRGVVLPAAFLVLGLTGERIRAALWAKTMQTALYTPAPAIVALAEVGLSAATMGKCKLILAAMLLVSTAAGTTGTMLTTKAPEPPAARAPSERRAVKPKKAEAPRIRTDRHGDPLPDGAIARLGTVRWRHGSAINALAYSPDGKKIAAAGGGVTLWDAASGKLVQKFHQGSDIALSPDGTMLATADIGVCRLWDVATGKELRQLKGGRGWLEGIAFAPNGKTVAAGDVNGTLRLWETATGAQLRQIDCKQDTLWTVAFSPDGQRLATGDSQGSLCLWDPHTGKELRRLKAHPRGVFGILFSPDGKRLFSSGFGLGGTICEWDAATGRRIRTFGEKRRARGLPIALSADGKLLASGEGDGQIRLWDMVTGQEKRHWSVGSTPLWKLAFSPDGKTLASAANGDSSIRLWDAATGRERHPSREHLGPVHVLRYSPDGKTLVSVSPDRRMLWWDLSKHLPRHQLSWTARGSEIGVALSPDGNTLAVESMHRPDLSVQLQLWDVRVGKAGVHLRGNKEKWLSHLAFSPDGRLLASGGGNARVVTLWQVRNGKEVRQLKGMSLPVRSLCFSPDGKTLAVGLRNVNGASSERTLQMWDVDSGKKNKSFAVHDTLTGLAFSPDGKVLAGGNGSQQDAFVRLWDVRTGAELCRHRGHRWSSGVIAFSPNGKLVASGLGNAAWVEDNSVHVWEAATGRLIRRFKGHRSGVGSVAFSPDGLSVASGGGDSTILLWDITGRRLDGSWHGKPLTPNQLNDCWISLAKEDAAKAYDAVWALVAAPEQTVPFLRKRLPPVPRPDAKSVARLIADLDNEDFTVRQKATEELSKLGDAITAALRRAIDSKPSLEVRRRIQQLLARTRDWTPQRLRDHRAIQALEHIGTRPARQVLQALAEGAPQARRTEEANAARKRLAR